MNEPKFKVGQFVYLKQDVANWDKKEHFGRPKKMLIIERRINECYNSIQNTYLFRGYNADRVPVTVFMEFNEIELTDTLEEI